MKRRFLKTWIGALAWQRHMAERSIRAHEHRQRAEQVLKMLCLINMRKVMK